MVQRIRFLGRVPLREFTAEDFRLILGQGRAVHTLLPLAIDLLESDLFAEGDFYPGDLLVAVVRVGMGESRVRRLAAAAISRLDELDAEDRATLEPELRAAYEAT
jgi:hypothetical protein